MALLARLAPTLFLVAPSLAADWFVDASANCAVSDGSAARPFCTIGEALAVASAADDVFVRPGTYIEALTVVRDVRIVGVGGRAETVVDARRAGPVITLTDADLSLEGVTLTGGVAPVGAGIHSVNGELEARHCAIRGNVANAGSSAASGAGIRQDGGRLVLVDVIVEGNHARSGVGSTQIGFGGGLHVTSATELVMSDCTIAGNDSFFFAAMFVGQTPVIRIEGTTFVDNLTGSACDETIRLSGVDIRLVNTTTAPHTNGEGISIVFQGAGSALVEHCTFVATCARPFTLFRSPGTSGDVVFRNSIVAGWIGPTTVGSSVGDVVSGGHNVIEATMPPGSGFVDGVNGDRVGVGDPLLASLAGNGGPTETIALRAGSPARDNGDPSSTIDVDQRGAPRAGRVRDSGAHETSRGDAVTLCVSTPNSTGREGSLDVTGDPVVSASALALTAYGLPADALCMFLTSRTTALTIGPGGSAGNLCLGGSIGRFARSGEAGPTNRYGLRALVVDPLDLPQPTGSVSAVAGETWAFQAWHRDVVGGASSSNFTDAVQLVLR